MLGAERLDGLVGTSKYPVVLGVRAAAAERAGKHHHPVPGTVLTVPLKPRPLSACKEPHHPGTEPYTSDTSHRERDEGEGPPTWVICHGRAVSKGSRQAASIDVTETLGRRGQVRRQYGPC